jgi:uncharacterized membrane protein YhaH (DUF805 family)
MASEPVMIHIKDAFQRFAQFGGHSSRAQFWNFFGFFWVVQVSVSLLEELLGVDFLLPISYLSLLIPYVSCAIRRIRDTGNTPWLILVPIVNFVMLLLPTKSRL